MSKQNKFFAVATTAALVASAIVPVASAADFKDADQIASWAKEAVDTLAAQEVISGNPDGTFAPKGNVTRAQAAKMFTVALDLPTTGTEAFTDVKDGQWFQEYVIAVSNAGIVHGMGAGLFAPNANLTRAQAAKMIVEAYGFEGSADLSKFADHNTVTGKWSEAPLSTAVAVGVINGKGNRLAANDSISRQEFAVMLTRAIDAAAEDNSEQLLADVEKATTALDTAVKALNTEVKANEIAEAKAEVAVAKQAITALETAVVAAKDVITTEASAKATAAIDTAKKAIEATEAVIAKAEEDAKVLVVESVQGISATQVEIKFNKAVDPASVFADGKSGAFKQGATVTFTSIETPAVAPGTLTGTLSADGKTLTVTAQNALSKRYDVVVEGLKDKNGKEIVKYDEMITIAADKTAPTIVSNVQTSASTYKVTFSEPLQSLGTVTYKFADGTTATVTNDFTAGAKEVTFTLDAGIAAGKVVTASFVGTQDKALNLLTPNPATVTFTKGNKDGVAPTVTSITQTGAKTYAVKFSEELSTAATTGLFTIAGNATVSVTKDSTDPTVYNVETTNVLEGATTVSIAAVTDLTGETTAATTKVVTFVKDAAAPKVVSGVVVKDATDNKEYLEVTFDKNVELSSATVDATAGTYSKDYVTTTLADGDITPQTVAYKDAKNKKVVRVALATLLGAKDVKDATYSLDLAFSGVTSGANVTADTAKVIFTRGEDGTASNATVLGAPSVSAGADNNKVNVEFTGAVDGASATNVANYKVDGAVVESVTLQPLSNGTQIAVLNLKEGSNSFTGVRNITVENVKALGSTKTMLPFSTNVVSLKENIAPTVTKADLTTTTNINLTFSEAVSNINNDDADFELYIGGVKSDKTLAVEVVAAGSEKSVLAVTVGTALTADELAKGITLKATSKANIADNVSNTAKFADTITVAQ